MMMLRRSDSGNNICAWMNQKLTEICSAIDSNHNLQESKVGQAENDGQDDQAAGASQDSQAEQAELIAKSIKCAQVETIQFREMYPRWRNDKCYFMKHINKCILNPVIYRLLNWQHSVRNFAVEFIVQSIPPGDIEKNIKEFGCLISNIFTIQSINIPYNCINM